MTAQGTVSPVPSEIDARGRLVRRPNAFRGRIKRHYYTTHPQLNPIRIVPRGPLVDWLAPHGRETPA